MPSILLIEDNLEVLDITTELLESEGYTIFTAKDGKDGFEKACHKQPDLIICDIVMPQWDGFHLLRELRAHPSLYVVPLLFYTARSEEKDIKKGLELGAYDYMVKPTNIDEFLATIRKCLGDNPPV